MIKPIKSSILSFASARSQTRTGVASIESVLLLSLMIFLMFSFVNLSLEVHRHSVLSHIAKDMGRYVSIRGESFTSHPSQILGTETMTGSFSDHSGFQQVVGVRTAIFDLDDLEYKLVWPDGSNRSGDPVTVEITYTLSPIAPGAGLILPKTFTAKSTASIH